MTLVLLHPLPLDGSIWDNELRALGSPCVAPTLYDLGDTLEEWAGGVLDLCGSGPLVLVGNSVGGSCALEIAVRATERVQLIVLVGSKPGVRPDTASRDRAMQFVLTEGMAGAWDKYWAPLFAPGAEPGIVERARQTALAQSIESIARGTRVFHDRTDRAEFASRLRCPIVVVNGEHDAAGKGAQIAAGLRHGSFRLVEGSGHYVPIERPAQLTTIVEESISGLNG